jgi:hypothetical protein
LFDLFFITWQTISNKTKDYSCNSIPGQSCILSWQEGFRGFWPYFLTRAVSFSLTTESINHDQSLWMCESDWSQISACRSIMQINNWTSLQNKDFGRLWASIWNKQKKLTEPQNAKKQEQTAHKY